MKTVVHQFPSGFDRNIESVPDKIELQWQNDYFFINDADGEVVSLNFEDGTLIISKNLLKAPVWTKTNSFTNPITNNKYLVSAEAKYNPEYEADEFTISLTEFKKDSTVGVVEGLVGDATVIINDNYYRFTATELWAPDIIKVKNDEGTVWHHYPYGGLWELSLNEQPIGEIVQGSPVVRKFGTTTNYGESFTILFEKEMDMEAKAELVNALMTYLALTDIEFYYYECDINNQESEACPGSILIN